MDIPAFFSLGSFLIGKEEKKITIVSKSVVRSQLKYKNLARNPNVSELVFRSMWLSTVCHGIDYSGSPCPSQDFSLVLIF